MADELNNQNNLNNSNENISADNSEKHKTAVDDFDYLLGEDGFSVAKSDDALEEPVIYRRDKSKNKKKTKKAKSIITVVVVFAVSAFLAFAILLFFAEYLGIGFGKGGECTVDIPKGMSTAGIAEELEEQGAISSSLMFRIYSKLAGYDGTYKYGVYTFANELGYKELARMLQTEGAVAKTVQVTIPERANMDEIMTLLADNGVCTKSDFRNAVINGRYDFDFVEDIPVSEVHYKFEGYLFPDTYDFYAYDSAECAELAIRKMLQNLDDKLTDEVRDGIKASGYSLHQILTMASIVELEASSSPEEMANVAAVFYNRLESPDWQGPRRLQSDPTMEYPYGNGRYDTYKSEGLPPGPMCSPSESAILGAVFPSENFSATYFVTDSNMDFYFNNSLSSHQQTIARLKREGKWFG